MNPFAWYEDLLATPEGRRMNEVERLLLESVENLATLMHDQGITSRELARRLEVSPARVSQMLDGTRNLTLASLALAFHALGRSMHVSYGPPTETVELVGEGSARKGRNRRRSRPSRG